MSPREPARGEDGPPGRVRRRVPPVRGGGPVGLANRRADLPGTAGGPGLQPGNRRGPAVHRLSGGAGGGARAARGPGVPGGRDPVRPGLGLCLQLCGYLRGLPHGLCRGPELRQAPAVPAVLGEDHPALQPVGGGAGPLRPALRPGHLPAGGAGRLFVLSGGHHGHDLAQVHRHHPSGQALRHRPIQPGPHRRVADDRPLRKAPGA